jgi:hypothetical protein
MSTQGFDVVDFGATFSDTATKVVSDATLAGLTYAEAFFMSTDVTGDNNAANHAQAAGCIQAVCGAPSGTNMTVNFDVVIGLAKGTFKFRYVAN